MIKKIEFKNISFGYNENTDIINSFSAIINCNQITSIYGQSGSGKSTLIKILLGILKPNDGYIKINYENGTQCIHFTINFSI